MKRSRLVNYTKIVRDFLTDNPTATNAEIVAHFVERYNVVPKYTTVKRKASVWRKEYRARLVIDESASRLRSYYDENRLTFVERSGLYVSLAFIVGSFAYLLTR